MIVIVTTTQRRYAVRREDFVGMRLVGGPEDLAALGAPDRPAVSVDLGALLDASDQAAHGRRHGLVVPLRRRSIVFLVGRVESMLEQPSIRSMPPLLARRLQEPWAIGVLEYADELALLLDLRAIARSVLAQRSVANDRPAEYGTDRERSGAVQVPPGRIS